MKMKVKNMATLFALLAASIYSINIPLSKLLLKHVETTMMAGLLYFGAGIGLIILTNIMKFIGISKKQEPLTKKELPYTIAMVILDIIAPILLMFGISMTNSANVSLWIAIFLVTMASIILSFEGKGAFVFNKGSLLVLAASTCWGFENNCTKMLSNKDPIEIVTIKGCFSGLGSIIIALIIGEKFPDLIWLFTVMLLGFIAYGLSICLYIIAQKHLGAAKTSAYYSVAPFLGVAFSMLLLHERPTLQFYIAFLIMIIATIIMVKDTITLQHTHEHEHIHSHEHRHGDIVHTHVHSHKHTHLHIHKGETENHEHNENDDELKEHTHTHDTIE